MGTAKVIKQYVTVEGTTYSPGTKVSDMEDGHADAIKDNPYVFEDAAESDTSVGAGQYDGKSWTVKKLQEEIDSRNEDRDDSGEGPAQIVPEGDNKPDLVKALELDDENQANPPA
jgi:hypothetical protein